MARKVEEVPSISRPRESRYPWAKWLDGNAWELTVGEDIPAVHTARNAAYSAARRLGVKIITRATDETLVIQAKR